MDLEFSVCNQTLKRKDSNQIVTSSSEYLRLVFDFETDDWENLDKYCFFRSGHVNYPFELTDEDNIVIPAYFLNGKYLLFGLLGMGDDSVRITTNVLRLHLEDSFYDAETVDVRNFLEVEVDRLDDRIDGKVEIMEGKMLSTNDFTNYYKNFLDGFDGDIEAFLLEHKAEIEALITSDVLSAKADKSYVDIELDKKADIVDVPTKTSDLVNDVPFLTEHQDISMKADKSYVDSALESKVEVSDFEEFDENIGMVLEDKADKSYVDTELAGKQDTLTSYSDVPNLETVEIIVTYTNGTTETYELLRNVGE